MFMIRHDKFIQLPANLVSDMTNCDTIHDMKLCQHKAILENQLPENLKLAIAKKIENNLFLKVTRPEITQFHPAINHSGRIFLILDQF
jgi:hypothetical protein